METNKIILVLIGAFALQAVLAQRNSDINEMVKNGDSGAFIKNFLKMQERSRNPGTSNINLNIIVVPVLHEKASDTTTQRNIIAPGNQIDDFELLPGNDYMYVITC